MCPPFYDYECSKGHETTVEHSIKADALTVCPQEKCKAPCKRLISGTGVPIFKGNGWTIKSKDYWLDRKGG